MDGPLVFILGAGASMPYGYPSGRGLVENIISLPPGIQFVIDDRDFESFQKRLTDSKAPSVDTFLGRDSKGTFERVGKLAIAETLLRCESHSRLFRDNTSDDWYPFVFNTLLANVRHLEQVRQLPISFVTFNYDRSLEQFLYVYLGSNFPDNTPEEVATVISGIPIIHVYGWLGPLDWQANYGRSYGSHSTLDTIHLANAAEGITILHQGKDDSAEFQQVRELCAKANSIFTLGFGYHPDNMRRLKLPFERLTIVEPGRANIRFHMCGTVYQKTAAEIGVLNSLHGHGNWVLIDADITNALRRHQGFLTFARQWSS
jgi:hypothetical protein